MLCSVIIRIEVSSEVCCENHEWLQLALPNSNGMKVILLRDVAKIGRKSEVKDVPDGHAINFLIPRKLAILASPENMKRITEVSEKHASMVAGSVERFKEALTRNEGGVSMHAEANAQGNLFKGIRAEDVATLLNTHGFALEKQHVVLPSPIKQVGTHEIALAFSGVKGKVQLTVIKK